MTTWGRLERIGGSEDATTVPQKVSLQDSECFVGRFAEPVKSSDSKFTHKIQTLIPCLFVSSTHFSLGKVNSPSKPNTYFIKDYSRNGTYLNGELVGPTRTLEFKDGAEISLVYKNKVRILYRFSVEGESVKSVSPKSKASAKKEERDDQEESSRFASMRSQADSVEYALNKQIEMLQEESKHHETRSQQQATRIESLSADLHRTSEKNAALEKQVITLEQEKVDLTDRLSTNESHSAAVEARNQKLDEQLEETRSELRDLKSKNAQLTEDLAIKTKQLEDRNTLMESSNKTMTHEKNKWTKLENQHAAACEQLSVAKAEIDRIKLASQTLQDIVSDREVLLANARQRYDKLYSVLEAGRGAVQAREESIYALQQKISNAAHTLQGLSKEGLKLTASNRYFEELTSGLESSNEWSSQLSVRCEDTYAEGSFQSQLSKAYGAHAKTSSPRSPPRSSGSSPAATPEAVQPTATGTVNGAESASPKQRMQVQVAQTGGQRLDIESEAASPPQGPPPTADSQAYTQAQGQTQGMTQVVSTNGQGRGSEKRKRSQESNSEGVVESSPKKVLTERAVVLTKVLPSAGSEDVGEGGEMEVQVESREESADEHDHEEEEEGLEDMQATQAPANFSHLFEDSDQEEAVQEDGAEVVQVMEVEEVPVTVEVVSEVKEVIELCSPPRSPSKNTSEVQDVSTVAQGLKAPSVTCTDDSASETSFDASAAVLARAAPSENTPVRKGDVGVSDGASSRAASQVEEVIEVVQERASQPQSQNGKEREVFDVDSP